MRRRRRLHPGAPGTGARRLLPLASLLVPVLLVVLAVPAVGSAGAGPVTDPSGPPDATAWRWPLSPAPEVVAAFDPPLTPYGPGHLGVDLLGQAGQTVTSVADGTVTYAGQVGGKPVVVVSHGAERSTYEPVVASVHRGDTVVAGQALGALTTASGHCLPLACLHLGRITGETYLDPLAVLGGGTVRLLPRHAPVESAGTAPAGAATRRPDEPDVQAGVGVEALRRCVLTGSGAWLGQALGAGASAPWRRPSTRSVTMRRL
jgi:hypothetical protein